MPRRSGARHQSAAFPKISRYRPANAVVALVEGKVEVAGSLAVVEAGKNPRQLSAGAQTQADGSPIPIRQARP
jgi:hypothetical protein